MIRKLIITTLGASIMMLNVHAQKRNNLKFGGIAFDNMFSPNGSSVKPFANKFGFTVGYERSIGSRITVGLSSNFYFPFAGISTLNGSSQSYSPAKYSYLEFTEADFTQSGYILGYESKYYFEPFGGNEPEGGFISMCIQTRSFNQHLSDAKYVYTNSYSQEFISFSDQTLTTNRIGIKLGATSTDVVSNEFYFSIMYNFPSNISNQQFTSPTLVRSISIGFGYAIGLPF